MRPTLSLALAAAALTAAVAASARPVLAVPAWMSEQEIASTFSGLTIDGEYADGRRFTETYAQDNSVVYEDGPVTAGGHWSVKGGAFCTIYDGDPAGGCFRVAEIGANCFEFYFVTRTEEEAEKRELGKPAWTARGWRKDRPATCREEASV